MLKDQRGLTLVELLIAIAIASIVTVSVGSFMVVGARTFTSTSSEVNLQHESQLAFNQLQDLVIDTTLGVTYAYVPDAIGTAEVNILSDSDIPAATTVVQKKLYMYNDTVVYVVIWDEANSELYYEEYDVAIDSSGNMTLGAARETHALMAEYITYFGADLTRLAEKSIVRVDMTYEKANKNYSSSYNITVRNKVVVNGDPAEFDPTVPLPDGINSLDVLYVEPGRSYDLPTLLSPTVTSSASATAPSQEVIWKMDTSIPAVSTRTGVDIHSGLLTVSNSEPGGRFNVIVAPRTGSASKAVAIYVVRVESVEFTDAVRADGTAIEAFKESESALDEDQDGLLYDDLAAGETFTLTALVDGPNVAYACETDPAIHYVNWDAITSAYVSKVSGTETSDSVEVTVGGTTKKVGVVSCTFQIKEESALEGGDNISIRATSQRSVDMIYPYENESQVRTPVIGIWNNGSTYKKEYDFDIIGSDLYRGGQPVIKNSDNFGLTRTDYFFIYRATVTEKLYCPDGSVETRELPLSETLRFYDNQWGSTNLKLVLKPQYLDPNAEYIFEVVCYVMIPLKYSGHAGCSTMYGTSESYRYNLDEAVAVGGNYKEMLHRVKVYYDGKERIQYIPREFNVGADSAGHPADSLSKSYSIAMMEGDIPTNVYNNGTTFAFYQFNNGKWEKYDKPINSGLFNVNFSSIVAIRHYFKNWFDDIPKHLRLVPTVQYNGKQYLMFDSYIDAYPWNIEVDDSWMGLSGIVSSKECYFPCPSDPNFPGVTANKKTWNYAFTTRGDIGFNTVRNQKVTYTISKQANGDDTTRYNLILYQSGGDTVIASYHCNSNERVWIKNP